MIIFLYEAACLIRVLLALAYFSFLLDFRSFSSLFFVCTCVAFC